MGFGIRSVSNPDGGSSLVNLGVALYIGSNSQARCQVQLLWLTVFSKWLNIN